MSCKFTEKETLVLRRKRSILNILLFKVTNENSGHKVALFKYPRWPKKRMPLSHRSIIVTPLSLTDKESVYGLSRYNCVKKNT